jgi:hypothetical protein
MGLEAQRKELTGWQNEAAREKVKGQMLALEFKQEPQLELAVKRRAQELGIERGSRVLQEKNLSAHYRSPSAISGAVLGYRCGESQGAGMDDRDDEGPTAAKWAFDALRAEVAAMRRAMRSLPEVILKNQPTDYTETLGAIAKKLEIVGNFMAAIEQHPAIRTTPAQYHQALAAAGEGFMHEAVRELDSAKAAAVPSGASSPR